MFIRRILTALALITGLAATGTPASAAMADAVSEHVIADASAFDGKQQGVCQCVVQRGLDPMKQLPQLDCRKIPPPVVIFIPTVQLGVDRALQ